ncbi:LysR family transcriptional regulator [soil metagenome]
MLDLECVASFLAVAACSGFREAARRTGLSQSAVSQQLKRLEQSLNVSLIERNHGGCRLTPEGKAFLPYAESLIRTRDRAQALFRKNSIAIGASSNVGIYLLQPYLKTYREHAGHDTQVVIGTNPDIADRLERLEIDVAVMEWWDQRPGFIAEIWRSEELVLIVPGNHRWAELQSIPRDWLRGEKLVGGESGSGTGRLLQQYFGEGASTIGVSMQLGSTEAVKRAVQAGSGISMVMASAVEEERKGGVKVLRFDHDPPKKDIFIVRRHTEAHHRSPALAFTEFLLGREFPAGLADNQAGRAAA